ncbi:MAG: protein kinase [Chthoniobacterales bacterium]
MKRHHYLDRYRIVTDATGAEVEIRRGLRSVVYKADDARTGEEVALEVFSDLAPEMFAELAQEAGTAQELAHVNVPRLFRFGREEEQFVTASEFFDGTTAEAWVATHGPIPAAPVVRIALQVVSTLGSAAFLGIVHGAINPRNILFVPGQTAQGDWPLVKVLDLVGLAPAFTGAQFAGEREFTAKFASPEQLENGTVDFQAEIYSLGATLWFLLTGEAPLPDAELPRATGIPKPILQLLEEMLSPDPAARPHDPVAFEERLRSCLEQVERREAIGRRFGMPVVAPAPPTLLRPARRAISWRPLAIAAILLSLATLGAFFLPENLRPTRWITGAKPVDEMGVAIGVPDRVARAVATEPEFAAATPDQTEPVPAAVTVNEVQTTSAAVAENAPPEPSSQPLVADNSIVPGVSGSAEAIYEQPALPPAEGGATAAFVRAAPAIEVASAPVELAPPAEGPARTIAHADLPPPPTAKDDRATEERESQPPRAKPEPAEPRFNGLPVRRAERLTTADIEPAPTERRVVHAPKRVKRVNGMEVRAAEPVYETAGGRTLPTRAKRGRYFGRTPDGELVFEAPEEHGGPASPRH